MPTANTTSRLGLMSPQDGDPFDPDDFDNTFQILDGQPGIVNIANYASLPVGLTTSQHGSTYRQLDNGAEWYWYQPSSGVGGVWKRCNSIGQLALATNGSTVITTATTAATAATVLTQAVTFPGGRSALIIADFVNIYSSGSEGLYGVALYAGSTLILSRTGIHLASTGISDLFAFSYTPSAPGATVTFALKIYTLPASSNGTSGSAGATGSALTVIEI